MSLRRWLQGLTGLSLLGLGISLYLSWIYLAGGEPICLNGSGCATVQASRYAQLGGVPVPVLGAGAYVTLLLIAVLAQKWENRQESLLLAAFGIALVGLIFSGYLTYLEFFVIRALCTWCLASAAVMGLAFGATALALRAFNQQQAD